ncbi:MAG: glycoside hydrolase family 27 protein [Bacteroidia bacterium]|nr:glycoside hydrolase family 27 protein [Bacteroidia bacterium]
MRSFITIIVLFLFSQFAISQGLKDRALTPPMGWNSWNWFGKNDINEKIVIEVIDAMVNEGLRDAGYIYVVVDGGWRDTKLGPNGELLSHPEKFPRGMKALADYAHSKGLKFGLHTVPGTNDCGGDPVGGYRHEEVQVKQFVDWGVDFIKLDKCKYSDGVPDAANPTDSRGWNEEVLKDTYVKWSNLLKKCDREIILSISAYVWRDWYPEVGQMARTTGDIKARVGNPSRTAVFDSLPYQKSVMGISEENNKWAKYAAVGYWNDPDMMVTSEPGLSLEEQKAHFALWSIMSSPLFLGNDPRNMTQDEKDIILNKDGISINQDPTEQGKQVKVEGDSEIWAKKLKNGKVAVLLLNRNKSENKNITLNFVDLGISQKVKIKDVYAKKDIGSFSKSISRQIKPQAGLFMLIDVIK